MRHTSSSVGDFETALAAAMKAARDQVNDTPTPEAPQAEPTPAVEPEPDPEPDRAVEELVALALTGHQQTRRGTHVSPQERETAVAAFRVLTADHKLKRTPAAGRVAEALGVADRSVLGWADKADVAVLVELAPHLQAAPEPQRPSLRQVTGRPPLNVTLERESYSTHFDYSN